MASSFGNCLKITIFGESHAKAIGMTIDGLPAGIKIDQEKIKYEMNFRHGMKEISTQRHENDAVDFLAGVYNGITNGDPVSFVIYNNDVNSSNYKKGQVRPSHADLTNYIKNNGHNDFRGGGFSSGRVTASFVVLGVICNQILEKYNIKVGSRILSIKDIKDIEISENYDDSIEQFRKMVFPVKDENVSKKMVELIEKTKNDLDSLGGVVESYISGLPVGLGEPYFDSLESSISHLLFSVGGVKGIEFGDGFSLTTKFGSEVSDGVKFVNGDIKFTSNHNGGINGGLSNGNILILRTAVKPTPSIGKPQTTINLETKTNETIEIKGRHDPCFVPRVIPIINALLEYVMVDMLMSKESRNI